MKEYGQFCGLARAAEIVGERWALLVLRDLCAAPRRYTDLREGLHGIPTNVLATRLRELEAAGLVARAPAGDGTRAIVYALTEQGRAIEPALTALGRWGASTMTAPRDGEVFTSAALAMAMRAAFTPGETGAPVTWQVTAGDAVASGTTDGATLTSAPVAAQGPDVGLVTGPSLRHLLAQAPEERPRLEALVEAGDLAVVGDTAAAQRLLDRLHVPLDPA